MRVDDRLSQVIAERRARARTADPVRLVCGHSGTLTVFCDRAWCFECNDLYEVAVPSNNATEATT